MTGEARAALEVTALNVSLSGRAILRDVSLSLRPGEFVALLGANGAGKTTLMRTILGLVPATRGRVQVMGRPVQRARKAIGYVPQRHEFAWDFPMSVEQVVLTGLTAHIGWLRRPGAHHRRLAGEALARVGLQALANRPIAQLSGGQRQRVLVARALVTDPALLLLDEPFTGLDMPSQEALTGVFTALAAEGCALLMTTHDLIAAVHECSRLCLIDGTVLADGVPETLGDPALWQQAFGLSDHNPLLQALVGAVHHRKEAMAC